mmetsp:Transcript_16235/g.19824  ORF Transcript_16235/g.19824 Transcript_16235/m.19824 type:complete len:346 (-) Transcript_16235:119-1156(-)
MATFQRMTTNIKAAAAPAFGVAVTSMFIGRYTTARTTSHMTNVATNKLMPKPTFCYVRSTTRTRTRNNNQLRQLTLSKKNFSSSAASVPKQGGNTSKVGGSSSSASNTSANQSSNNQKTSFLEWYEKHLESNPVITKMVSGSILWGLGDFVAQKVPPLFFEEEEGKVEEAKGNSTESSVDAVSSSSSKQNFVYDYPRTARAMFFGFSIHAPLSHVHFNLLEWMTIKGGFTGLSIPVFKAFMEQFVYWSWFSNSLYHGAMGAMQGMSTSQIYDRIVDVLWETQKAQWVFWIPVQLLNFKFVPVRHQLNVVLVTSIVWTALLSAWYPPEEDDSKNKKIVETEVKEKA